MNRTRFLRITVLGLTLLTASIAVAQDLSSYRTFRFGASLESVARGTGTNVAEAKTIHTRPALIQELEWRVRLSLDGPSSSADSVKAIVFSFYNDQLFRIAVNYNFERTNGLTNDDMIESISAQYGAAKRPTAKTVATSSQTYGSNEKVIACWEDTQFSFNLYRSSYEPMFGLVAYSKRLDVLAQAASAKAVRQDEQEAPGRLKQQAEESRIAQEKARSSNKITFRP